MSVKNEEIIVDTYKAKVEHPAWKSLMAEFSIDIKKTFVGMEGEGFNSVLKCNGKKVADVSYMGDGGIFRIYWMDNNARTRFNVLVKQLPKIKSEYLSDGFECDVDFAISFLAEVDEMFKKIKRSRSPKVLFSDGDKTFEYRNTEMSENIRRKILSNHPNALIWNDLL